MVEQTESTPPQSRWWHILAIDLRSLALFRIAIGAVLFCTLISTLPDVEAFYTDRGVLPRAVLRTEFADPWAVSIHMASGQWAVQLALILIAIVFALCLAVGYYTKIAAVGSWFLLMSLQARNGFVLSSGDGILRLLLFWSMFVPLGSYLSIDRMLNPTASKPNPVYLSAGSLALMLQLCFVYWFAAALKTHAVWRSEGSAIYYALSLDQFATGVGRFLLGFPDLLRVLTFGTLLLEAVGPILVFCPALGGGVRLLMVLVFIGFHAGIGSSLHLGNFSWVCAAAWLMFVPPIGWELLRERARAYPDHRMVIYYDGNCGFCKRVVAILRELLRLGQAELREAQSDPEIDRLMHKHTSWIVRDPKGNLHTGYAAFVTICSYSPVARRASGLLGSAAMRRIGERAYHSVAAHRERAARVLAALTPPAPKERLGYLMSAVAVAGLAFVFVWNVSTIQQVRVGNPEMWARVAAVTQLRQQWMMFAPFPTNYGGWYVLEGVTADGRHLDVWNGGSVTGAKPADVAATYGNNKWRKYLVNLSDVRWALHRPHFARYLCRRWNERHPGNERVTVVNITFMFEKTPAPGQLALPPRRDLLWREECSPRPADR